MLKKKENTRERLNKDKKGKKGLKVNIEDLREGGVINSILWGRGYDF
jgi:hypothetical protein